MTAPSAIKVNISQYDLGKGWAEWIVKQINGQGNVIMVTGVAGTQVDLDRNKGADSVWAKNPGIKVVNRFTGMWDSSTAERNTAAVLPSLPKIDAIWCQGGTDGVLKAFISANRPLPPTAGEAENGFRKMMLGIGGHRSGLFRRQPALPLADGAGTRAAHPGRQLSEEEHRRSQRVPEQRGPEARGQRLHRPAGQLLR